MSVTFHILLGGLAIGGAQPSDNRTQAVMTTSVRIEAAGGVVIAERDASWPTVSGDSVTFLVSGRPDGSMLISMPGFVVGRRPRNSLSLSVSDGHITTGTTRSHEQRSLSVRRLRGRTALTASEVRLTVVLAEFN